MDIIPSMLIGEIWRTLKSTFNLPLMDTNNPQDLPQAPAPASAMPVMKLDKDGNVNTAVIPTTDQAKYGEISKALNPSDVNSILNFGSDLQGSMEKYSNDFLTSVRTFNSGEVGGLINELEVRPGTSGEEGADDGIVGGVASGEDARLGFVNPKARTN